jgi:hypothetical protein
VPEKSIPVDEIRPGDIVRMDYQGELRDSLIVGWRFPKGADPIAQVMLFSGIAEYRPQQLVPGGRLLKGVTVAKVWRSEPDAPAVADAPVAEAKRSRKKGS